MKNKFLLHQNALAFTIKTGRMNSCFHALIADVHNRDNSSKPKRVSINQLIKFYHSELNKKENIEWFLTCPFSKTLG